MFGAGGGERVATGAERVAARELRSPARGRVGGCDAAWHVRHGGHESVGVGRCRVFDGVVGGGGGGHSGADAAAGGHVAEQCNGARESRLGGANELYLAGRRRCQCGRESPAAAHEQSSHSYRNSRHSAGDNLCAHAGTAMHIRVL